jgi:hypothetical protein
MSTPRRISAKSALIATNSGAAAKFDQSGFFRMQRERELRQVGGDARVSDFDPPIDDLICCNLLCGVACRCHF